MGKRKFLASSFIALLVTCIVANADESIEKDYELECDRLTGDVLT